MTENHIEPSGEFLLYETDDGKTRVECRCVDDTLWLAQVLMAEMFQKDVRTINEHLQSIYKDEELTPDATIRNLRIVRQEGNQPRNQLEKLTPSLLSKAFCGELVPQDPDDEPASELLKRITAQRESAHQAKRGRHKAGTATFAE